MDIPLPFSEYQVLNGIKSFNMIYPLEHRLSMRIRIDMVVRAIAFDDEDYSSFANNEITIEEMEPVGGKFLELAYIRETSLRGVTQFEWDNNYGPGNMKNYPSYMSQITPDSYVKIISLRSPSYSLNNFNKRYGKSVRTK
jgi:hypothetical protein